MGSVKVIVLGESGVGKSTLLARLAGEEFCERPKPTLGIDYYHVKAVVRRKPVNVQLWDTAGQERYRSVIPLYYSNAHLALAVYDITSRTSFDTLEYWLRELQRYGPPDVAVVVIGNKKDLEDARLVTPKPKAHWIPLKSKVRELSSKELRKPQSLVEEIAKKAMAVKNGRKERAETEQRAFMARDADGNAETRVGRRCRRCR